MTKITSSESPGARGPIGRRPVSAVPWASRNAVRVAHMRPAPWSPRLSRRARTTGLEVRLGLGGGRRAVLGWTIVRGMRRRGL